MYRIGIDVGGTFTDLAAVDERGRVVIAKCASTPKDPSAGLMEGLGAARRRGGHGSRRPARAPPSASCTAPPWPPTRCSSARARRSGCSPPRATATSSRCARASRTTATTCGCRRRCRWCRARCAWACASACGRRPRGDRRSTRPRCDAGIARAAARQGRRGRRVLPARLSRRRATRRAPARGRAQALPGAYVSLSSEVLPQIKEYERIWTTVVNAYVGPRSSRYLASLAARLTRPGYRGDVSSCSRTAAWRPSTESSRLAAGAVLSGPAGGVAGGRYASRLVGEGNLITVRHGRHQHRHRAAEGGEPQLTGEKTVGVAQRRAAEPRHPHARRGRRLHRAGSMPAASCTSAPRARAPTRGRPATARAARRPPSPTPTSCSAISIPPTSSAAASRLDARGRAARAVEGSRAALGIDALAAARASPRRQHQHGGGHPDRLRAARRGSAPLRAARPSAARPACTSPRSRASSRSAASSCRAWRRCCPRGACSPPTCATSSCAPTWATSRGWRPPRCADSSREMEAEGRARLGALRRARHACSARSTCATASRSSRSRCRSTASTGRARRCSTQIVERFHRRHEELYTYSAQGQEVVVVNARVAVVGELPALSADSGVAAAAPPPPAGRRRVYLAAWIEVPVHRMDELPRRLRDEGAGDLRVGDDDGARSRRRARHRHAARLARSEAVLAAGTLVEAVGERSGAERGKHEHEMRSCSRC